MCVGVLAWLALLNTTGSRWFSPEEACGCCGVAVDWADFAAWERELAGDDLLAVAAAVGVAR